MSSATRVAIVTGAAQGIGFAIALRLAKDGFNVAVNDIADKRAAIDSVVSEIQALGREAVAVPGDVSSEEDVKAIIALTVERLGGLDVMVANAGVGQSLNPLVSTPTEEFDKVISVNSRGAFLCYKHAAIQMIAQGRGGNIVGTCSLSGKRGVVNLSAYSMSKFAVRGLTQTAALELRQHNIRVNGVSPGVVDTPLLQVPKGDKEAMELVIKMMGYPPETPHCSPDPIASIVSYLVSPEAYFITGQTISVDGGIHFD